MYVHTQCRRREYGYGELKKLCRLPCAATTAPSLHPTCDLFATGSLSRHPIAERTPLEVSLVSSSGGTLTIQTPMGRKKESVISEVILERCPRFGGVLIERGSTGKVYELENDCFEELFACF